MPRPSRLNRFILAKVGGRQDPRARIAPLPSSLVDKAVALRMWPRGAHPQAQPGQRDAAARACRWPAARLEWYKAQGRFTEIVRYQTRLVVPTDGASGIIARIGQLHIMLPNGNKVSICCHMESCHDGFATR